MFKRKDRSKRRGGWRGVRLALVAGLALASCMWAAPVAVAQQCTVMKVELASADVAKSAGAAVVRIPAPGSVALAVGDAQGLIAVGALAGTKGKVLLYNLAGDGAAAPATSIDLPVDPQLEKYAHRPVALVFHPRLPFLYVWQELVVPSADLTDPAKGFIKEKFFHGLIYQLGGAPKLVESFGNGWRFDFAAGAFNGMAISPSGNRLFVPAGYMGEKGPADITALSYFELGADGLTAKDAEKTPVLVRQPWGDPVPNGWGVVPGNDDVVVVSNRTGFCTWDIDNRLARYTAFHLNIGGATLRIGGDPGGTVVYGSSIGSGSAFSMLHADGYITLIPRMISLPQPLTSRPVAMPKRRLAAIPARDRVYLAGIDENGELTGKVADVAQIGFMGGAMGYSQKTDRLYITVETAQ